MLSEQKKNPSGLGKKNPSAQISSRTSLGALDKRHLERPFPPPPSAVLNLASFSAVGLGEDLFIVVLVQLLGC